MLLLKNLAFSLFEKRSNRKKEELCAILKEKKDEKDKFDFNEQKRGCWVYPSANDLGNTLEYGIRYRPYV